MVGEVDGCREVTNAAADRVRTDALKLCARGQSVKCKAAREE